MAIWIDTPVWPAHGRLWSHLVSDTSYAELHAFARANGIPRRACEGDHYDVPQERYADLVAAGARPVDGRDIVRMLQRTGMRVTKRRRERVLDSLLDPPWLPPGSRADIISSAQGEAPTGTVVVRLLVLAGGPVAELAVVTAADHAVDLPSLPVGPAGPAAAVAHLEADVVGEPVGARLVGYVRHRVPGPQPGYRWPPTACFALFARTADAGVPFRGGHWIAVDEAAGHLGDRPWWPLLPEYLGRPRT